MAVDNKDLHSWAEVPFGSKAELMQALSDPRMSDPFTGAEFNAAVERKLAISPNSVNVATATIVSEPNVVETDGISAGIRVDTDGSTLDADEAALMALTGEPKHERRSVLGAVGISRVVDGVNVDEPGNQKPTAHSVAQKLDGFEGLSLTEKRAVLEAMPIAEQAIAFQLIQSRSTDD